MKYEELVGESELYASKHTEVEKGFENAPLLGGADEVNYGSNCELILSPRAGDSPVSSEAYDAFYELMTTYRYPMRYLAQNQDKINALSPSEKTLLENDELQFINKKFSVMYPEFAKQYKIDTIPKSLYQVHAYVDTFYDFLDHEKKRAKHNKLRKKDKDLPKMKEFRKLEFNWGEYHRDQTFEDYCAEKMNSDTVKATHLRVNNELLKRRENVRHELSDELAEGKIQSVNNADVVRHFLLDLRQNLQSLDQSELELDIDWHVFHHLLKPDNVFINFVEDMVLNEWESRKKANTHYVYQGMSVDINKRRLDADGNSWSYGDGFFGGGVNDADTAMAFSYVAGAKGAFNFSITEVQKRLSESPEDVIYIPRVSSLVNLYGGGEFHHPRSKIAKDYNYEKHTGIQGMGLGRLTSDDLQFLESPTAKTSIEMQQKVNDYQKARSVELRSKQHFAPDAHSLAEEREKVALKKQQLHQVKAQLADDPISKLRKTPLQIPPVKPAELAESSAPPAPIKPAEPSSERKGPIAAQWKIVRPTESNKRQDQSSSPRNVDIEINDTIKSLLQQRLKEVKAEYVGFRKHHQERLFALDQILKVINENSPLRKEICKPGTAIIDIVAVEEHIKKKIDSKDLQMFEKGIATLSSSPLRKGKPSQYALVKEKIHEISVRPSHKGLKK